MRIDKEWSNEDSTVESANEPHPGEFMEKSGWHRMQAGLWSERIETLENQLASAKMCLEIHMTAQEHLMLIGESAQKSLAACIEYSKRNEPQPVSAVSQSDGSSMVYPRHN